MPRERRRAFAMRSLALWPLVISFAAVVVSAVSLVYTIRVYGVAYRPYLGIVDSAFRTQENGVLVWNFVVKNVGTIPALLIDYTSKSTITARNGTYPLPELGERLKKTVLIMPGQTMNVGGSYNEAKGSVPMSEISGGDAKLDAFVELKYRAPGWQLLRSKYYYSAQLRFMVIPGVAPAWTPITATAN